MNSRKRQRIERAKRRKGGMAYESATIDPDTGRSLSGGDNSPEACRQRLRVAEAWKRLDAEDEEAFPAAHDGGGRRRGGVKAGGGLVYIRSHHRQPSRRPGQTRRIHAGISERSKPSHVPPPSPPHPRPSQL